MPLYEYYCPRCKTKYELLRPMGRGDEPATCPQGHNGGVRAMSLFASVARTTGEAPFAPSSSGGCACGGGSCACGH